ncbi:MAG: fasciclin domain-containing protein [Mesotoga sp.]
MFATLLTVMISRILTVDGPFTVLAPTDKALVKLAEGTIE